MARDGALLSLDLPDRAQAPAAARKALTALNGSLHLVSEARLRDAQLLVSELVGNAVRHGGHSGRGQGDGAAGPQITESPSSPAMAGGGRPPGRR
jgi:anti-sigma regulatory factor (Ser/Thr protein kinase)